MREMLTERREVEARSTPPHNREIVHLLNQEEKRRVRDDINSFDMFIPQEADPLTK